MRTRNRLTKNPPRLESLEQRTLLTVSAQPDYINVALPADATGFPSATVDVLENDQGANLRIDYVGTPALGTVERVAGEGPNGRELLRYVPGQTFRGTDAFKYAVTDDDGQVSSEIVYVSYSQNPFPYSPWSIVAPTEIVASANSVYRFTEPDGQPLIAIDYDGLLPAQVGVLLRWPVFPTGDFSSLGSFATGVTRSDANFYPFPSSYAWLFGSIDGVNALLADLTYTAGPGFNAPEGITLTVQAHLYSNLVINIDTKFSDINFRVSPEEGSPKLADDIYIIESLSTQGLFDVLANDAPGQDSSRLEVIDVELLPGSASTAFVTPGGDSITYQPGADFRGTEKLIYTARNDAGLIARAFVEITVRPDIFAVATLDGLTSRVEVFDKNTGRSMGDFVPFDTGYSGNLILELADLDGDGQKEIVAMQAQGERRMRVFDMDGTMLADEVVNPFAGRRITAMDMAMGDMDGDGKAEMIFAAVTSRGTELRALDGKTMRTEMSTVLRGMVGQPQISMDDELDQLTVLGRTPRGGVTMALISGGSSTSIMRRTIVSDRDMRTLTRRYGTVSDVALIPDDPTLAGTNSDGVRIAFRNGTVRTIAIDMLTGSASAVSDRRITESGVDMVMASIGLAMTPSGQWVWSVKDSNRQNRIRAVAMD